MHGVDALHRGEPAVAAAGEGFDKAGIAGLIAERVPEAVDGGVEAVLKVDEGAVRPQFAANLFSGEDLGGALKQHAEDLERLSVEFDAETCAPQLAAGRIELEDSKAVEGGWRDGWHDC